MKKFLVWFLIIILVVAGSWLYRRYFYVFGEGVKTGHLNYVVYKGDIFKTYEGKLIQVGIRSETAGSIQFYEFEFSVVKRTLANFNLKNGGKSFDLHYKEYLV